MYSGYKIKLLVIIFHGLEVSFPISIIIYNATIKTVVNVVRFRLQQERLIFYVVFETPKRLIKQIVTKHAISQQYCKTNAQTPAHMLASTYHVLGFYVKRPVIKS